MSRSIVAGVVVLAIILTCGILEVVLLRDDYKTLHEECLQVMDLCQKQELTTAQFEEFRNKWYKLRETSEIFLPHPDVYELNLRFAEAQAYAENADYLQLYAQLAVIEDLLRYVPHLMTPSWRHVV